MVALTDGGAEADARARVAQAAASRAELERSRLDSEKAIASSQARWLDEELGRKSELLLSERRAASALVGVPPAPPLTCCSGAACAEGARCCGWCAMRPARDLRSMAVHEPAAAPRRGQASQILLLAAPLVSASGSVALSGGIRKPIPKETFLIPPGAMGSKAEIKEAPQ